MAEAESQNITNPAPLSRAFQRPPGHPLALHAVLPLPRESTVSPYRAPPPELKAAVLGFPFAGQTARGSLALPRGVMAVGPRAPWDPGLFGTLAIGGSRFTLMNFHRVCVSKTGPCTTIVGLRSYGTRYVRSDSLYLSILTRFFGVAQETL